MEHKNKGSRSKKKMAGMNGQDPLPSALNLKKIDMTALCRQTGQTTPTTVGFHAHMMMISPFLVDACVEFPTQMAFHAITCVLWSSHTGLRV
jgi:hypothetical protein